MTIAFGRCTVTVCRGCCCGTQTKHPDVDHASQVEILRARTAAHAALRVTDCLGACERSNVVVVSPSRVGRGLGGRPTWFGHVLDDEALTDIADWVSRGGPGIAAAPATLALYAIDAADRV